MSQQRVMKLGTRGKRFAAAVIDCVPSTIFIVYFLGVILQGVISLIQTAILNSSGYSYYSESPYVRSGSGGSLFLIILIVYWGFQIFFWTRSQSIGKAILKLRVVDAHTGRPIGFAKMLLREVIVKKASAAVLWLGYIWILIDKYNRSWHDKILETYVIDESPAPARYVQPNMGYNANASYNNANANNNDADTASGFQEENMWNARQEAEHSAREEIMQNLRADSDSVAPMEPASSPSAQPSDYAAVQPENSSIEQSEDSTSVAPASVINLPGDICEKTEDDVCPTCEVTRSEMQDERTEESPFSENEMAVDEATCDADSFAEAEPIVSTVSESYVENVFEKNTEE